MNLFINAQRRRFDAQPVIFMRRTGPYGSENYALMQKFKAWLAENNLLDDETVILACALDDPTVTPPERCRYDVCAVINGEIPPCAAKNSDISTQTISGGEYLVFTLPHTAEAATAAWQESFSQLATLGLNFDGSRPVLERYLKKQVDSGFFEFCLPIR